MKTFFLIASLLISATACNKRDDHATQTADKSAKPQGAGHGKPDAVPGSHEDWCEEHGVPESQDTRCDPSLIPAFKATGDWCDEHGVPESQCLKCNPDLKIVRPPKK